MNLKELSNYTSLSESTIRRAIKKGQLKCSIRTGKLLFNITDAKRWLNG
ncbi:helix-turn-helix domain-containing protein [Candidatus Neomarinimicrobiota bacterium]